MDFGSEFFWTQLRNLLMACMNRQIGEQSGNTQGRVMDVDVLEADVVWGIFLKIRVEIDLKKAVVRGRAINLGTKRMWVLNKYE